MYRSARLTPASFLPSSMSNTGSAMALASFIMAAAVELGVTRRTKCSERVGYSSESGETPRAGKTPCAAAGGGDAQRSEAANFRFMGRRPSRASSNRVALGRRFDGKKWGLFLAKLNLEG
jgi:hypothetical protein